MAKFEPLQPKGKPKDAKKPEPLKGKAVGEVVNENPLAEWDAPPTPEPVVHMTVPDGPKQLERIASLLERIDQKLTDFNPTILKLHGLLMTDPEKVVRACALLLTYFEGGTARDKACEIYRQLGEKPEMKDVPTKIANILKGI